MAVTELPSAAADIARAVATAGRELLSVQPHRSPFRDRPDVYVLRTVQFSWRWYAALLDQQTFLFFRRSAVERPVARADVIFEIGARPPDESSSLPATLVYRVVRPALLVLEPDITDYPAFEGFEWNESDCIVLRAGVRGDERLFIKNPDWGAGLFYRARVAWRPAGGDWIEIPSRDGWLAAPFVSLLDGIERWIGGALEQADELPFEVPQPDMAAPMPMQFLAQLGAACHRVTELLEAMSTPSDAVPVGGYRLTDYRAEIALRLDTDAQLSAADRAFQLGLTIERRTTQGPNRLRIALRIPDFLVSGPLHESFSAAVKAELDQQLADGDPLRSFAAHAHVVVFRVSREREADTDAVILRGFEGTAPRLVILRVVASVDAIVDPPTVHLRKLEYIYDDAEHSDKLLPDDAVCDLFILINDMLSWRRVLQWSQ